jgi:hypothetical protein
MLMFTAEMWREQKRRFVQSYQASAAITRATALFEMTDHRFLTADRSVQETTFANGVIVRVNFGDQPFNRGDTELVPGAISILGLNR